MLGYLFQAGEYMRAEKQAVRWALQGTDEFKTRFIINASYGQIEERHFDMDDMEGMTPVGTVEFCRLIMRRLRISYPPALTYPDALKPFLGRSVEQRPYNQVPVGWFVKPVETKEFDGHIKPAEIPDGHSCHLADVTNKIVWCAPPVRFITESRFYVVQDNVVGFSRYDDAEDDAPAADEARARAAVATFARAGAPAGYALDFGVTDEGETLLVEANDGWALGFYRWGNMPKEVYARLIAARWKQILTTRPKRAGFTSSSDRVVAKE